MLKIASESSALWGETSYIRYERSQGDIFGRFIEYITLHFPTRTIHSLVLSFSPIYIDFFRMHYVAHCIQRYTSCKLRPPKQHIDIYTIHSFILYTIFQWRSNDTNVATVGPFEYGDTFYSSYRVLEPKIKLDRSAKASWVVFEFINCISFRQKFSRTG